VSVEFGVDRHCVLVGAAVFIIEHALFEKKLTSGEQL
jgi:hypothetical protein